MQLCIWKNINFDYSNYSYSLTFLCSDNRITTIYVEAFLNDFFNCKAKKTSFKVDYPSISCKIHLFVHPQTYLLSVGEFVLKLRLRRAPDSWVFKGRSFEESAFLYSAAAYRSSCRSSVLEGNISTEVIDAEKGLLWGGVSSTKWRLPHKSGRVTTKRSFYANKKLLRG